VSELAGLGMVPGGVARFPRFLDENGTKWRPGEVFLVLAAAYARTE
jgi:hypothetical protein